jgi:phosphatidylserine/phosphatidylglycerophosphate/cardiolipin synthase-like enzyme
MSGIVKAAFLDVIVSFIDGSRQSLDVAVQELESRPIADALIHARQRGVLVRVVLEGDFLSVRRALADPWSEGGINETNRQIHDALQKAKIKVTTDFNPDIFHQKFVIRDEDTVDAAILTGSTNFTPTGVASNLNHILIAKSKKVAREYSDEFRKILDGTFGSNQSRRFSPRRIDGFHIAKCITIK